MMRAFRIMLCLCGSFLFGILLTSCSQVSDRSSEEQRPYVLSMNRMIHDCVQEIVGDRVVPIVLIDGSIDPHSYEMVKGDEDKIAVSQLIFCNGLGLEHTASLRKHLEHNPKAIFIGNLLVSKGFVPLQEEGFSDPHIWTVMRVWRDGIQEIITALVQEFPQWEGEFRARGDALLQKMAQLDDWATQSLSTIPEHRRYLVSGHSAFGYFTKYYLATEQEVQDGSWRERCIAPEGVSPEAQVSVRDIIRVANYIQEHDIQVVFSEDTMNQDAIKKVLLGLGKHNVRVAKDVLYSDNVRSNYFLTFVHNVKTITEELGGSVIE